MGEKPFGTNKYISFISFQLIKACVVKPRLWLHTAITQVY